MKNRYLIVLFSFILMSFFSLDSNATKSGNLIELKKFGTNKGNLNAYYHAPINAKPNMPMVVVLHGCSQSINDAVKLTEWNKLADKYGFYVLYPEQKRINNASKCFNWFMSKDFKKNSGENLSIYNMVNTMSQKFSLNSNAFYITGMSAGAAMSVILIANYPELFKGAAIVSGGPFMSAKNLSESRKSMLGKINKSPEEWGELVRNVNPTYTGDYPKVIIFHGKNDPVVNFKNSNNLIDQWSNVLGVIDSNFCYKPTTDIKRIDYFDGNSINVLSKVEIDNMGHAYATKKGTGIDAGGGIGLYAKDKDYFTSYWSAKFFGLIP